MDPAPRHLASEVADTTSGAQARPRGWVTVTCMAVAVAIGPAALLLFAFGTFIKSLAGEYGWGRGEVSAGIGVFTLAQAFGLPVFGAWVDRIGPRRPAMASVVLLSCSLAAMSRVRSDWAFMAVFLAMGLVAGGATGLPYSKAITTQFHRRRGLAFGLGAAGLGVGGAILPHVTRFLLSVYGWRGGFVGLGIMLLLLSLPSALIGLPDYARDGRTRVVTTAPFRPWREASYWIIGSSLALIAASVGGVTVHAVALLTDRGVSSAMAATLLSALALASVAGRVAGGYLMDLFFAPKVAASIFLAATAGCAMLLAGSAPWWWAAMLCVGFVTGADANVITYIVSRYCAAEHFGKLFGLMMLLFSIFNGVGVYMMGALHDAFGSYDLGLGLAALLALTSAALVLRLGAYTIAIEPQTAPSRP